MILFQILDLLQMSLFQLFEFSLFFFNVFIFGGQLAKKLLLFSFEVSELRLDACKLFLLDFHEVLHFF